MGCTQDDTAINNRLELEVWPDGQDWNTFLQPHPAIGFCLIEVCSESGLFGQERPGRRAASIPGRHAGTGLSV